MEGLLVLESLATFVCGFILGLRHVPAWAKLIVIGIVAVLLLF